MLLPNCPAIWFTVELGGEGGRQIGQEEEEDGAYYVLGMG